MKKAAQLIGLLLFGVLLSGCANERMRELDLAPPIVTSPSADKATVVFMRPSYFGGAIQSSVFDITDGPIELVGIISAGRKIAYASKAGQRRFMVAGEAADFMDAELTAGKTYYARVKPRLGLFKARFSLVPVAASAPELEEELNACKWVDNTPASYAWAAGAMPSLRERVASYLPDWEKKPTRPVLPASAGK